MTRASSPHLLRSAAVLLGLLALGGCGSADDGTVTVLVVGDLKDPFQTGARLPYAAQLVRSATVEGLVGLDEQGRVIPALADRWIVTDDGLSYIFRLRDGIWADGTAITGENARASLMQALAGLRGTPLAADLSAIGEVRAMAGRVIEIRLTRPVPDLLQLLAQPELGLARKGRGVGPMAMRRDGDYAVLTPIAPEKRGLTEVRGWSSQVRSINLAAVPAKLAVERFDSGQAALVLGGRIEQFPRAASRGFTRGALRMDAVMGLFGLLVVHDDGFLGTRENREALAMAIDRDGFARAYGLSGWAPTTRIVSPGTPGDSGQVGERWTEMNLAQRQAEAQARVQRHGGEVRLRVAMPGGPGADVLFARIEADFAAIGVTAQRVAEGADADLRLVDAVARYPRATWFLNQLSCAALAGPCSAGADTRAGQARAATDAASRTALLAEAEAELAAANVFIPFGAPVRWSLVGGGVSGFSVNRWGFHPLMPLAMRTK